MIPVQLDEIRQIEVVEGPNSALFEFNAASGVINNITYDALFDQVNTATMRFGSQALLQGSAVAIAHIGDNVGVRMSVGGLEQHEFEGDVSPSVVLPPLHNPALAVFNIDSKVRVAPGMEVTLEASSATSQLDEVGLNTLELYDTYRTNSFKAGVMADTAWGTIAVNAYRNREGVDANVLGVSTSLSNTVYVLQASDTLNLNADHTIRMSLEYRNNTLNSPALIGGGVGYAVYSASGRWDWQITPALSFTNSVRIDYLALDHSGMLLAGTGFTNTDYDNTTIAQPGFNSGLARLIHTHSRDSETTIVQHIECPHRSGVTTALSTRSTRVSQWPLPLVPQTRRPSAFPLLNARRWWRRLTADASPPTVASCCSAPSSGNSVSSRRLRR